MRVRLCSDDPLHRPGCFTTRFLLELNSIIKFSITRVLIVGLFVAFSGLTHNIFYGLIGLRIMEQGFLT
jgi:hypothetical protein